jgi:hypothetical protein
MLALLCRTCKFCIAVAASARTKVAARTKIARGLWGNKDFPDFPNWFRKPTAPLGGGRDSSAGGVALSFFPPLAFPAKDPGILGWGPKSGG